MKNIKEGETQTRSPFERFKLFTTMLAAVPKKEIDEKQEEYDRDKKRRKRKKTAKKPRQ